MTNKDELFRQFIEEATRPGPEDAFIEQGGEIIKQVTASLNWFGKKWCAEWVGSRAKGTNVKGSDGDMMVKVKEKENGGDEPSWSSVATGKHCTEGAEVESKVTRKLRGEFGRTVVEALQQKGFRRVEEQGLWVALNFKYSVECDHIAGSDRPPTIECSIDVTFLHSKFTFPVMELVKNNFLEDPEVKVAIKSFKYLGKGRDNLPQLAGIEIEAIALASIDIEKGVSSGYSHFQDMVGLFGKHKSALSFNAFIKDMCKKRCFNYEFLLSEGNFNAYKQVAVHVLNWIKVDRSFEEIFSGVKTERLHANNTTAAEHVTKLPVPVACAVPQHRGPQSQTPILHRPDNKTPISSQQQQSPPPHKSCQAQDIPEYRRNLTPTGSTSSQPPVTVTQLQQTPIVDLLPNKKASPNFSQQEMQAPETEGIPEHRRHLIPTGPGWVDNLARVNIIVLPPTQEDTQNPRRHLIPTGLLWREFLAHHFEKRDQEDTPSIQKCKPKDVGVDVLGEGAVPLPRAVSETETHRIAAPAVENHQVDRMASLHPGFVSASPVSKDGVALGRAGLQNGQQNPTIAIPHSDTKYGGVKVLANTRGTPPQETPGTEKRQMAVPTTEHHGVDRTASLYPGFVSATILSKDGVASGRTTPQSAEQNPTTTIHSQSDEHRCPPPHRNITPHPPSALYTSTASSSASSHHVPGLVMVKVLSNNTHDRQGSVPTSSNQPSAGMTSHHQDHYPHGFASIPNPSRSPQVTVENVPGFVKVVIMVGDHR